MSERRQIFCLVLVDLVFLVPWLAFFVLLTLVSPLWMRWVFLPIEFVGVVFISIGVANYALTSWTSA